MQRPRSTLIMQKTSNYKRPDENLPEPGKYDGHLTPFAADIKTNIGMGSKYVFKPDRNPPPGAYDIDAGHNVSKTKSRAAHIREEVSPYRRPKH